jgi:hypothetical protein
MTIGAPARLMIGAQFAIVSVKEREEACRAMGRVFLRDPHGLHDIGVEIEGLRRAPGPRSRS